MFLAYTTKLLYLYVDVENDNKTSILYFRGGGRSKRIKMKYMTPKLVMKYEN